MSSTLYARVAELVDALASGASVSNDVEVQVLSRAPNVSIIHVYGEFITEVPLYRRGLFCCLHVPVVLAKKDLIIHN